MPDDTQTDPYAGTGFEQGTGRITQRDTTSGARDSAYGRQVLINSFIGFGYYPKESEIAALMGTTGGTNWEGFAASSVANYVNMQKAEIEREKNDPLAAFQRKMMDSADLYKTQVQGLYGQLQDTLGKAPELFGNLKPEQIDAYLAPLKRSFDTQLASVQGVLASRGMSGSSSEANALAQTGEQFKESALSTGLQVGMKSQSDKAAAIQNQINQLLGLAGGEEKSAGAAAAQRSQQGLGQSNLIQSLPFFFSQAAKEDQLYQKAMHPSDSTWGNVGRLAGDVLLGPVFGGNIGETVGRGVSGEDINPALNRFSGNIENTFSPQNIIALLRSIGGDPGGGGQGPQTPGNPSGGYSQNYDTSGQFMNA